MLLTSCLRLIGAGLLCLLLTTRSNSINEEDKSLLSDARLATAIAVSARAQPLTQFIDKLPLPDTLDIRTVRIPDYERVTAFAKNIAIREMLDGVRVLFGLDWEPSVEKSPAFFTLVKTSRARLYEDSLYRKNQERMFKPLMTLAAYTRLSAPNWAHRRRQLQNDNKTPDDPLLGGPMGGGNLRSLSRASSHAGLQILLTLTSTQRQQLQEDEALYLPWSQMTGRQRELAESVISDPEMFENSDFITDKLKPETLRKNLNWLREYGLRFDIVKSPSNGGVLGYDVSTGYERGTIAGFSHDLYDKNLLPVRGCPYPLPDGAVEPDYSDLEKKPFPKKFLPDRTKFPAWTEALAELFRKTDLSLLSDDFPGMRDPIIRDHGKWPDFEAMNLAEGLDALCRYYGKLWWREGNRIYFRSRTWFVERLYEPPLQIVQALDERMRQEDGVGIGVLDLLARLTSKQLQGFANGVGHAQSQTGPVLYAGAYFQAQRAYPYVQFFRQLNTDQKRRALTAKGLAWDDMSDSQQQAYFAFGSWNVGRRVRELSPLPFQVKITKLAPQHSAETIHQFVQIEFNAWQRRAHLKVYFTRPNVADRNADFIKSPLPSPSQRGEGALP